MAKNIVVITAIRVLPEILIQFIKNIDNIEISGTPEQPSFSLNRGEQNLWIYFDDSVIKNLQSDAIETIKKMEESLQASPETCISIEISRDGNSERLALELANYFVSEFSGIVYDLKGRIYSSSELAKMIFCEPEPIF
jgi:hypothetical protein